MKDILTAPFIIEMGRICTAMYAHGWDERNSGNISLLLTEEEIAQIIGGFGGEQLNTEEPIRNWPRG